MMAKWGDIYRDNGTNGVVKGTSGISRLGGGNFLSTANHTTFTLSLMWHNTTGIEKLKLEDIWVYN